MTARSDGQAMFSPSRGGIAPAGEEEADHASEGSTADAPVSHCLYPGRFASREAAGRPLVPAAEAKEDAARSAHRRRRLTLLLLLCCVLAATAVGVGAGVGVSLSAAPGAAAPVSASPYAPAPLLSPPPPPPPVSGDVVFSSSIGTSGFVGNPAASALYVSVLSGVLQLPPTSLTGADTR